MMCFQDRTFCADAETCANRNNCHRYLSPELDMEAYNWSVKLGLTYTPVSMGMFKEVCDKYVVEE